MKRYFGKISWMVAVGALLGACNFLEEDPKTFLSPDVYYTTEAQVMAAVNGTYTFLDDIFDGDIERGTQTYLFMDYLAGYGTRPYAGASTDIYQAQGLTVAEDNNTVGKYWRTAYLAIENCNSVIEGITGKVTDESRIMSAASRDKLLGEVYFIRAHFYFNLVRLFGEVPLKLTSTKSLDVAMNLASQEAVYTQIETDLIEAERLMTSAGEPIRKTDGRISLGAVKALLAKVYLTQAGYPMQKGTDYYTKAYQKASELVGQYTLAASYAEMREKASKGDNSGEYIWALQRNWKEAGSPVHNNCLPYPAPAVEISKNPDSGGAMAPHAAFVAAYPAGDLRATDSGFFYTKHIATDGATEVTFDKPYLGKWWDQLLVSDASQSGSSGANWPFIRYSEVLLIVAEAKAAADGGTTSDATAVDAYWGVRSRALPDGNKPASITVDQVLKERIFELCFEDQTWYDMIRTRKALNTTTGEMANMIGLRTPGHNEGSMFGTEDLLFPYPIREVRLNPNLVRQ
jgi:hypothetical protein